MKFGTVDAPCGMTMFASGGDSSRHNDLYWLRESGINAKMEAAQQHIPVVDGGHQDELYCMYGDSIFPWMSCLQSRYHGPNINDREILENECYNSCRESIEWHYGETKTLWPFVSYENKQQLLKTPVTACFVTAMILRNCYVACNENKTSKTFNCIPPTLESWLGA
jgi:hypothetical protein